MADESFFWANRGFDLHLLTNKPYQLDQVLMVFLTPTSTPLSWADARTAQPPPDVTVEFKTGSQTFTDAVHGVTVDETTGLINSRVSPNVRNFIVTAVATTNDPEPIRTSIRVFLHNSLRSVQLSPSALHIPAGSTEQFSVLGVFNDKTDSQTETEGEGTVVGDLTDFPGMGWEIFDGNRDDIRVTPSGIIFTPSTPQHPDQSAKARATVPVYFGDPPAVAVGDVFIAESWARDVLVEPVGPTRTDLYNDGVNVLFLPDGFVGASGKAKFERAANSLERELRKRSCRPFDLFSQSHSIHYFRAWIPSNEAGGTVLNDLAMADEITSFRVPIPRDPDADAPSAIGDVQDLTWVVGLPTRSRAARSDFLAQRAEWAALFGLTLPQSGDSIDLWLEWKKLYPRFVAVERDTLFGIAHGRRPSVTTEERERRFGFNLQRAGRDDVDRMLARLYLESETGAPLEQRIGRRWATRPSGDTDLTKGADVSRVFIICDAPISAGMESAGDAICLSLTAGSVLINPVPTLGAIVEPTIPDLPSDDLPADVRGAAAHELAHSLHLGDEYAEFNLVLPSNGTIADFWNLTSTNQVGNPINPLNIRWGINWKRLQGAGALLLLPSVIPGGTKPRYVLHLRPGHGRGFKKVPVGTRLRFRRRPLVGTYAANEFESERFTLALVEGDRLEVELDDANSSVKTYIDNLSPLQPSPSVPPEQVLVIAPRLDKANNEMGLMHARIGQLMQANGPLNRTQGNPCRFDGRFIQEPINFLPGTFATRRYITRIVGLYDGGATYSCGVYHPQGYCIMRSQVPTDIKEDGILVRKVVLPLAKQEHTIFCPVCRYILVDIVNPSYHGTIDDEYDGQYPDLNVAT